MEHMREKGAVCLFESVRKRVRRRSHILYLCDIARHTLFSPEASPGPHYGSVRVSGEPSSHVCLPLWLEFDPEKNCTCSASVVAREQKRNSGPLLNRINIQVDVPRVNYEKLSGR